MTILQDDLERHSVLDDAELLERCRTGDRQAFGALWRRHAPGALRFARSLGPPQPDPEDVVGEAFTRIMRMLWEGRGPQGQLRPYLFTAIRNIRYGMLSKAPPMAPTHELDLLFSQRGMVDETRLADVAAITSAFRSLPERWQEALWFSEVEQMAPRQIAGVLGLAPNSVAALTYRAREALRKAWIQAQLQSAPPGTIHRDVIELLGSYVRGSLRARARATVDAHLGSCASCRAAEVEARHLTGTLGVTAAAGSPAA